MLASPILLYHMPWYSRISPLDRLLDVVVCVLQSREDVGSWSTTNTEKPCYVVVPFN